MLELQRTAGNQAVGAMLGRQRPSGRMVQRLLIPELRSALKTSVETANGPLTRHEAKNIAGHLDTHDSEAQQRALIVRGSLPAQAEALRDHYEAHRATTGDAAGWSTDALPDDAAALMGETENPTVARGIATLLEHSMETYQAAYGKATRRGMGPDEAHDKAVEKLNPYVRYGQLSTPMGLAPAQHHAFLVNISEAVAGGEAENTFIWVQQAEGFLTAFAKNAEAWTRGDPEPDDRDVADIQGMVAVYNLWNTAYPDDFPALSVEEFFSAGGQAAPEESEEEEPELPGGRRLPLSMQRAMLVRGREFDARTRANTHNKPEGSRAFLRAIAARFGAFSPHWKAEFANTFYHYKQVDEGPAVWRVYVSVKPAYALKVFSFARDMVGVIEGVNNAKVAGPREVGTRADTIVIYTETKAARANVVRMLERYQRELGTREEFMADLPLGTKHKLRGVSTAQEPGKTAMDKGLRSYGSVFEDAILIAFQNAEPDPDIQDVNNAMWDRLEEVGFDPYSPSHFVPDPPQPGSGEEEEEEEDEGEEDFEEDEEDEETDEDE